MTPGGYGDSETGFMRRAVGGALDATVGRVGDRVGDTARGLTDATARQVIEDLEPYLISQTVPHIVEGVMPYLVESIVPDIVDGVSQHLAEVTVPAVVEGATPALVQELLPQILEQLQPYLERELVPKVVDALVPHLSTTVAPELIDALMPKIEAEVAPQLVTSLMPMIRAEVVPQILDDIVDDPKVRDLIREQSQGMVLDGLERVRRVLAVADDVVEKIARRILRREPRPLPGPLDVPALPSRRYVNAGVFSRGVALGVDIAMVGFFVSIGLNAVVGLLHNIVDPLPQWLNVTLAFIAFLIFPSYLALSWMLTGNTIAQGVFGLQECTDDGRRMLPLRALVKAWTQMVLLPVWLWGMIFSPFSRARKGLLDMLTGTQVRYFVHGESVEEPRRRLLKGELGAP